LDRELPLTGTAAPLPPRSVQLAQYGQLRHAKPIRQYSAIRHDYRSRNPRATDPVRVSRDVLVDCFS
jgi:hypothetical protein